MIDYSKWDEKMASVMGLALDPRNPRIPSGAQDLDERSLIEELVRHEKVYDLAKEISENGFFPVESLVVLAEGGKNLVLEGNRRLAAMKLLLNPDLAPADSLKRFKSLAALSNTDSLKKVRVVFAPSREAAAPLIMQKHTKEQIERWSPLMQARYFRSLMAGGGLSVDDLSTRYKLNKSEVTGFLRLDTMYEAACALPLAEAVKKVVHDPRKFPASVLQRLIDSPKGREALGVTFDTEGALHGTVQVDEFKKGLGRVLADIVNGKADTRTLNSVKEIEGYLQGLGKDAPDLKKTGTFSLGDVVGAGKGTSKASSKAKSAKMVTRRLSRSLLSGVKCRVSNQKIREVFEEVRKLDVEKFPNTTAAMLRILLELCVGNYLDKTDRMKPILAAARAKGRPSDWYPTWKQMLQEILKEKLIEVNPMARKRLTKLVNDPDYTALDGYVHNRFVTAHPRDLRDLGGALEDIFSVVLADPASKAA